MKKKISVDLSLPAAERLKLLAELTKQARADKLAEPAKAKAEMSKAYFSIPKELKGRFAQACCSRSQNEVIVELMERFTKQAERGKPVKPEAKAVAETIKTQPNELKGNAVDSKKAEWLDLPNFELQNESVRKH